MFKRKKPCSETGIHKFQPRYDEKPGNVSYLKGNFSYRFDDTLIDLARLSRERTYVKDVCVYCGKTIKSER